MLKGGGRLDQGKHIIRKQPWQAGALRMPSKLAGSPGGAIRVVAGKIWDGLGYWGVVPYHGMVWDHDPRSHTNPTSKDIGYYAVPVAS